MKAQKIEKEGFEPIEIKITIESAEELFALKGMFNGVPKCLGDGGADFYNILHKEGTKIKFKK